MTTLHLVSLFHTVTNNAHSHCAFTGKVLRFPRMMKPHGYRVVEYGWEGSESEADEHIILGTEWEREELLPQLPDGTHMGAQAKIGSPLWKRFHRNLVENMRETVKAKDIICHPFGRAHQELLQLFPQALHVETGIGYPDKPFGAWRIWESEAWRHWHWGHWGDQFPGNEFPQSENRVFSWVIPNYYDPSDWPLSDGSGDYVLFMGRFIAEKGVHTIRQIIEAWHQQTTYPPIKFVFAGTGDWQGWLECLAPELRQYVEYRGSVIGKARAELCGQARCMLMPTNFIEPFGGSGVECMLTGTPLIASDFGAFTETIWHGNNGYRCKTLGDWVAAIKHAPELDRYAVANVALARYSLDNCGAMYDQAFQQLLSLYGEGWNSLEPRNMALL
jgi:glycosyltransferase involved in cell wall biosynthesis